MYKLDKNDHSRRKFHLEAFASELFIYIYIYMKQRERESIKGN